MIERGMGAAGGVTDRGTFTFWTGILDRTRSPQSPRSDETTQFTVRRIFCIPNLSMALPNHKRIGVQKV
jgi:hypothetical protein